MYAGLEVHIVCSLYSRSCIRNPKDIPKQRFLSRLCNSLMASCN